MHRSEGRSSSRIMLQQQGTDIGNSNMDQESAHHQEIVLQQQGTHRHCIGAGTATAIKDHNKRRKAELKERVCKLLYIYCGERRVKYTEKKCFSSPFAKG